MTKTAALALILTAAIPTLARADVPAPDAAPAVVAAPGPAENAADLPKDLDDVGDAVPTAGPTAGPTPPGMTTAAVYRRPVVLEKAEPTSSINVNPFGLVLGMNAGVTYEHLWGGTHGLVVEGDVDLSSNTQTTTREFGGAIGYRLHLHHRQNSSFVGFMIAHSLGTGSVSESSDGGAPMSYPVNITSTSVTANVGKRWMLGDAFNITARFGLGWAKYTASTNDSSANAQNAVAITNALLQLFPIGVDAELSVGYTF